MLYILKVNILLLLFAGIYHVFLRKETFYQANRFFLLGGVLCSFLLPSIFIEKEVEISSIEKIEQNPVLENVTQTLSEVPIEIKSEIDYSNWISIGVIMISVVLLSLLFWKIILLLKQLKKLKWKEAFGIKYLESKNENEAFSFYKYIVVNTENMEINALKKILVHENIHVREFHTFDVLLIQIIEALFWFNPFLRFYRKGFEETHEFLADEKTINENSFSSYDYQKLIVQLQIKNNSMLTNSFKKESTLKNRVLMLQKRRSAKTNILKVLFVIPFLVSFMMFSQTRENTEKLFIEFSEETTDRDIDLFEAKYARRYLGKEIKFENVLRDSDKNITGLDFLILDEKTKNYVKKHGFQSDVPELKLSITVNQKGDIFHFKMNKTNFDIEYNTKNKSNTMVQGDFVGMSTFTEDDSPTDMEASYIFLENELEKIGAIDDFKWLDTDGKEITKSEFKKKMKSEKLGYGINMLKKTISLFKNS
ncbi:M56 family metallopeptidase [Aureivirga sp. CE67]|uniref:M56 family metallopeptidase n=1 Tax=Aureivirga sp. CE67 TaxID=1788983 RepID=UPI0018CB1EC2|nr:M56 family metallopeptidase [Aureivirga sp. CE67]